MRSDIERLTRMERRLYYDPGLASFLYAVLQCFLATLCRMRSWNSNSTARISTNIRQAAYLNSADGQVDLN